MSAAVFIGSFAFETKTMARVRGTLENLNPNTSHLSGASACGVFPIAQCSGFGDFRPDIDFVLYLHLERTEPDVKSGRDGYDFRSNFAGKGR